MTGVRCSVSLLQSQLVKVPVALGILKQVILLPLGLITHLPPEQVETILLHELELAINVVGQLFGLYIPTFGHN